MSSGSGGDKMASVSNDPFLTHTQTEDRQAPSFRSAVNRHRLRGGPSVWDVVISPALVLFFSCCGFLFGYYYLTLLPWLLVAACLLHVVAVQSRADIRAASPTASGATMQDYYDAKSGLVQREPSPRQASRAPLFMGCLGLLVGTVLGLWLYENRMATFWVMTVGPWYTNAVASNPAATYSDAGAINFAASARVDNTRAVGYHYQATYCAAPVLSAHPDALRVSFWAVGIDCCGSRGSFWCDGDDEANFATISAVPEAPYGWLSRHDRAGYELAIKQAEALYGLSSDPQRMLIRWVENPKKLRSWMILYSLMVLLITTVVFLVFGVAALVLLTLGQAREDAAKSKFSSV